MSISAMANVAISKREASRPAGTRAAVRAAAVAAQQPSPRAASVTEALDVLVTYIPTEILTIYVAVIAVVLEGVDPGFALPWWPFFTFLGVTPLAVWVVVAGKLRAKGRALPRRFKDWPKWEMVAATLAFVAWAMALPDTPFKAFPWYSGSLAGLVVLIAAAALGLLAPIFMPKAPATT